VSKPDSRDTIRAEFAQRLARHLADRSWNQSDLARAASKHLPKGAEFRRDNISVYVNGNALPRPKQLNAIAKALGVAPGDLLPSAGTAGREVLMPFSMRPVDGEQGMAWLQVDMKVPMRKALAVLSLLDDSK
jgi:hypothetical protein